MDATHCGECGLPFTRTNPLTASDDRCHQCVKEMFHREEMAYYRGGERGKTLIAVQGRRVPSETFAFLDRINRALQSPAFHAALEERGLDLMDFQCNWHRESTGTSFENLRPAFQAAILAAENSVSPSTSP